LFSTTSKTKKERKKRPITVEVQLYVPGTQKVIASDDWFYLGYLMYHEIHLNTTTIDAINSA
jgi:hypothetical protein